jgi:hypothetical protein
LISTSSSVEAELDRVLKSKGLREPHQLSSLLSYVVGETLAGRTEGLKEYSLGLEVFHRPKTYDPRNDAIVRVQASLLRKRLAAYYEGEGKDAKLRIEIPRGGYVPEFREATIERPIEPLPVRERRLWPSFAAGLLAGAALFAIALYFYQLSPIVQGQSVWNTFLNSRLPAVASFGVPLFYAGGNGLYLRDVQVNAPSEESNGRIQWIGDKLQLSFRPQEDVYTGVGDAIGTHLIARWVENHGVKVEVANSNYIGPSDIEGKNLIVVASARFQTLLQRIKLEHRYHFSHNGIAGGYRLDNPLSGEQPFYTPFSGVGVSVDYGVLSMWPGKVPGTRILYLSGVNSWTTQGIAEFVIDNEKLVDLQTRLDSDPADGPRGRRSPFFQILIQVEGKNGRARSSKYVSHRYLAEP